MLRIQDQEAWGYLFHPIKTNELQKPDMVWLQSISPQGIYRINKNSLEINIQKVI